MGFQAFYIDYNNATILPPLDTSQNKIWFRDSSAIYEIKYMNIDSRNTPHGEDVSQISFRVLKYTYIDLRTLQCQDYYNFSDTALPINNYYFVPRRGFGWEFFKAGSTFGTLGIRKDLPDTIIGHDSFKRIKISNSPDFFELEFEYFLDRKAKKNIFHLNRTIEEMYPECKVVQMYMKDNEYSLTTASKVNILKAKLTNKEKRIFKSWSKNAQITKLPLISHSEANSMSF